MSPQPLRHPPPLTREQQKARYQAFQRAGRARAALSNGEIAVPDQPEVLMVEGGAFVEARIWVPEGEIQPEIEELGRKPEISGRK